MSKSYFLSLYFKQGDDLCFHMKDEKSAYDGLMSWANHLENAASHVERLAAAVKDKDVNFECDGIFVHLYGDETVLDDLVKDNLIEEDECDDDNEHDDGEE